MYDCIYPVYASLAELIQLAGNQKRYLPPSNELLLLALMKVILAMASDVCWVTAE